MLRPVMWGTKVTLAAKKATTPATAIVAPTPVTIIHGAILPRALGAAYSIGDGFADSIAIAG